MGSEQESCMPQHEPTPDQAAVRVLLGRRIRALRRAQGVAQEELAHKSGLDRSYVGSIERGERNVSIDNITALSRALNVPVSTLLTFPEE